MHQPERRKRRDRILRLLLVDALCTISSVAHGLVKRDQFVHDDRHIVIHDRVTILQAPEALIESAKAI